MPNKENIRKWRDALLSGEYEQAKGKLKIDGKYCCLGVACEVAMKNGVRLGTYEDSGMVHDKVVTVYDNSYNFLPEVVVDWLDLDDENPIVENGYTATYVNDDLKWNFEQIAHALTETYQLDTDDEQ